jgi:hypothetical protein
LKESNLKNMKETIVLDKMPTLKIDPVNYFLRNPSHQICLNDAIGQAIFIQHTGNIYCGVCGVKTKKSFGEGMCYKCFSTAPENAECIIRPELCLAHEGIGRDIEWEKKNHLQPHHVYLALVNEVKVGVTRETQIPTRWIDQGANAALILATTPYRQLAGMIEISLKSFYTDKTNWQKMLKNEYNQEIDLRVEKEKIKSLLPPNLSQYIDKNDEIVKIHYPVMQYPDKVKSVSFEKTTTIESKLMGIRGQYLLLEDGQVFNVRKHSGYEINLEF